MKNNIKSLMFVLLLFIGFTDCSKKEVGFGDLAAPSDIVINTTIIGQDGTHPNGDGSGDVKFALSGESALGFRIDYDASDAVNMEFLPLASVTKKYTKLGLNTYRVTVVAYGKGGTSTTTTKEVTVQSNFTVAPEIESALTNGNAKTWVIDKNTAGHFGVGPWSTTSVTPEWYGAAPNEKAGCCFCFYSAKFTFAKVTATNTHTLQVVAPDGAFTKTGTLTSLPGIPASGAEGCYSYSGGTSDFSFVPSSSGIAATAPSTKTSILLAGDNTYIGYGALQKEYEILSISPTAMYLRVQGTETGNAWYIKLIPE